jgi:2-oxo-4-hydroxy-4-carboxy-5-ureidoimidazoline decarboxylase
MSIEDRIARLLNGVEASWASRELQRCCASWRWVEGMMRLRPFASDGEVFGSAERIWLALGPADWLEAFAAHPRIGEDPARLRARFGHDPTRGSASWSRAEQAGVSGAPEATLAALAAGNRDYAARFGFVFLVCATGKSAAEMLALLRARLPNDPAVELRIAAGEQLKITQLRLAKLADEHAQVSPGAPGQPHPGATGSTR